MDSDEEDSHLVYNNMGIKAKVEEVNAAALRLLPSLENIDLGEDDDTDVEIMTRPRHWTRKHLEVSDVIYDPATCPLSSITPIYNGRPVSNDNEDFFALPDNIDDILEDTLGVRMQSLARPAECESSTNDEDLLSETSGTDSAALSELLVTEKGSDGRRSTCSLLVGDPDCPLTAFECSSSEPQAPLADGQGDHYEYGTSREELLLAELAKYAFAQTGTYINFTGESRDLEDGDRKQKAEYSHPKVPTHTLHRRITNRTRAKCSEGFLQSGAKSKSIYVDLRPQNSDPTAKPGSRDYMASIARILHLQSGSRISQDENSTDSEDSDAVLEVGELSKSEPSESYVPNNYNFELPSTSELSLPVSGTRVDVEVGPVKTWATVGVHTDRQDVLKTCSVSTEGLCSSVDKFSTSSVPVVESATICEGEVEWLDKLLDEDESICPISDFQDDIIDASCQLATCTVPRSFLVSGTLEDGMLQMLHSGQVVLQKQLKSQRFSVQCSFCRAASTLMSRSQKRNCLVKKTKQFTKAIVNDNEFYGTGYVPEWHCDAHAVDNGIDKVIMAPLLGDHGDSMREFSYSQQSELMPTCEGWDWVSAMPRRGGFLQDIWACGAGLFEDGERQSIESDNRVLMYSAQALDYEILQRGGSIDPDNPGSYTQKERRSIDSFKQVIHPKKDKKNVLHPNKETPKLKRKPVMYGNHYSADSLHTSRTSSTESEFESRPKEIAELPVENSPSSTLVPKLKNVSESESSILHNTGCLPCCKNFINGCGDEAVTPSPNSLKNFSSVTQCTALLTGQEKDLPSDHGASSSNLEASSTSNQVQQMTDDVELTWSDSSSTACDPTSTSVFLTSVTNLSTSSEDTDDEPLETLRAARGEKPFCRNYNNYEGSYISSFYSQPRERWDGYTINRSFPLRHPNYNAFDMGDRSWQYNSNIYGERSNYNGMISPRYYNDYDSMWYCNRYRNNENGGFNRRLPYRRGRRFVQKRPTKNIPDKLSVKLLGKLWLDKDDSMSQDSTTSPPDSEAPPVDQPEDEKLMDEQGSDRHSPSESSTESSTTDIDAEELFDSSYERSSLYEPIAATYMKFTSGDEWKVIPELEEDEPCCLLSISLTSVAEIITKGESGKKKLDNGTGWSFSYPTLIIWLLSLVPGESVKDSPPPKDAECPFSVRAVQHLCLDKKPQLLIAVTPNADYQPEGSVSSKTSESTSTTNTNSEEKFQSFYKQIQQYLANVNLFRLCPAAHEFVQHNFNALDSFMSSFIQEKSQIKSIKYRRKESNDTLTRCRELTDLRRIVPSTQLSFQLPGVQVSNRPLLSFITVSPEVDAVRENFCIIPSCYWHAVVTGELWTGGLYPQYDMKKVVGRGIKDCFPSVFALDCSILLVSHKLFHQRDWMASIFFHMISNGGDLVGVRLIYIDPKARGNRLVEEQNMQFFLSYITSNHPSVVFLFRGIGVFELCKTVSSNIPGLTAAIRIPVVPMHHKFAIKQHPGKQFYPENSELSFWFNSPKFGREKRIRNIDTNTASVVVGIMCSVVIVISPLVPANLIGKLLQCCQSMGYGLQGVVRSVLTSDMQNVLKVKNIPLYENDYWNHLSVVMVMGRENALYHMPMLVRSIFQSLSSYLSSTEDLGDDCPSLSSFVHVVPYNKSMAVHLGNPFTKIPLPVTCSNWCRNCPKLYGFNKDHIVVVIFTVFGYVNTAGYWLDKFTKKYEDVQQSYDSDTYLTKWIVQLVTIKLLRSIDWNLATLFTPYLVGDIGWKESISFLSNRLCLIMVFSGLNAAIRLEQLINDMPNQTEVTARADKEAEKKLEISAEKKGDVKAEKKAVTVAEIERLRKHRLDVIMSPSMEIALLYVDNVFFDVELPRNFMSKDKK